MKISNLLLIVMSFVVLSCNTTKPFNMVLLPDTQSYVLSNPDIFQSQVDWILENQKDIRFVMQQGDLTQNNNDAEWKIVANVLGKLDGKLPYAFAAGNHDIGSVPGKFADNRNSSLFNQYMPFEKYSKQSSFGGAYEEGKMENVWHEFKAGGKKWLVITLEFGPRDIVLDWAKRVIESHPKHLVIINTHTYLYADNTHHGSSNDHKHVVRNYGVGKIPAGESYSNEGIEVWNKLVKNHANIRFVFSGHVTALTGVGRLVSEGIHGNQVYQMLANYQKEVKDSEQGTTGYLRIVQIDVKGKKISVKTYSPTKKQFRVDKDHQFEYTDVSF